MHSNNGTILTLKKVIVDAPLDVYHADPGTWFSNNDMPSTCDGLTIPMCTFNDEDASQIHWLTKPRALTDIGDGDNVNLIISWPSYHTSLQVSVPKPLSITALLPMFRDNAHSPAIVKHGMNIIKQVTNQVIPSQLPVLTVD